MRKLGSWWLWITTTTLVAASAAGAAAQSTPAPSPDVLRTSPLAAGPYLARPFDPAFGGHDCMEPPQAGCVEDPANDGISFALTVREGWNGQEQTLAADGSTGPGSAGPAFSPGPFLYSDPCRNDEALPDLAVGPTVEEYAKALASNRLLDVTNPVDVTLSGYTGRYLDLQVPADLSSCAYYMPWAPGIWAQGPNQRWHIWILDVEGSRVLVVGYDYPSTPAPLQAELAAIVDSIEVIAPSGAVASASPFP